MRLVVFESCNFSGSPNKDVPSTTVPYRGFESVIKHMAQGALS